MSSFKEYNANNYFNDIIFDLNDINSFLYTVGYITREKYLQYKKTK